MRTVADIQLYTVLLILRLGVVRELLGPVVGDLLSSRNPDRSRRLRGDMVHELSYVSVASDTKDPNGLTLVKAGNRPGLPMTLQ
jgi:hypothetical protein